MSRTTRRAVPIVAGLATALASLPAVGAVSAAHADETASPETVERAVESTSAATLTWGVSGYAQNGIFGPWRFIRPGGNASLLSGNSQTEYVVPPFPETSFKQDASPFTNPQAVKFTGGTGTADPTTGEATVSWTGTYTINAYPPGLGAPDEKYSDPQLTIDENGDGALSFDVFLSDGQDIMGNPTNPTDLGRITVLTFGDEDHERLSEDSFRLNADYFDVVNDLVDDQDTSCTAGADTTGWWGSYNPEWVSGMEAGGLSAHWYSTGCSGKQDEKPPLPLDVDYNVESTVKEVAEVSLVTPNRRFGQDSFAIVNVASAGDTAGTATLSFQGTEVASGDVVDGQAVIETGRPPAGSYPLQVRFSGNDETDAGTAESVLRIVQAASSTKANFGRKPARRKNGKVKFSVASPTADPEGRVRVIFRRPGQKNVTKTKALNNRNRGQVTLPRAKKKGTYRVVVRYLGTGDFRRSQKKLTFRVR